MASKNVMEFTSENWEKEVLQSDKPVMVDFWAPWCGPCRQLAPAVDSLAEKYAGRLKVGKVNTDDNQQLAVDFGISGIPQVLFFKGGKQHAEKIVGLVAERELAKSIDRVLAS
jgi:thioredoxin 1